MKRLTPLRTNTEAAQRANLVRSLAMNAVHDRMDLVRRLNRNIDGNKRDIDDACSYPRQNDLSMDLYRTLYKREGIATRVVKIFPEESWKREPVIIESEAAEDSEFEKGFKRFAKKWNLWSVLERADILSGIGSFGVIYLGIDDGRKPVKPVKGLNDYGKAEEPQNAKKGGKKGVGKSYKLRQIRVFDESEVEIKEWENDEESPRYGMPKIYTIDFGDSIVNSGKVSTSIIRQSKIDIHWTRIVHIADNRQSSEFFGAPRQELVLNRIFDIRKLLGASGEMFWLGAFPGLSFEIDPKVLDAGGTIDKASIQKEVEQYANNLQRYLTLEGLHVEQLLPTVANPTEHFLCFVKAIAMAMGIPFRVLLGSEQAQLASQDDIQTWNNRIAKRRVQYVTPYIINPVVERLIAYGVILPPSEIDEDGDYIYSVEWPSLEDDTMITRARVGLEFTQALTQYASSPGASEVLPPDLWMIHVMGMSVEQVNAIDGEIYKRTGDHLKDYADILKETLMGGEDLDATTGDKKQKDLDGDGKLDSKHRLKAPNTDGRKGNNGNRKRPKIA